MGIIRKLIYFSLIFYPLMSFSQKSSDTLFTDGQYFLKHIVKYNQTLEYVSGLYNISKKDIKLHNDISNRLYYNQLLYIPIDTNKVSSSSFNFSNSSINNSIYANQKDISVALLLPFYLKENHDLIELLRKKGEPTTLIYEESKLALTFFQGVELALDSLRKLKKRIHLKVFDTANDTIKIHQLVNSGELDNTDIIIGPIYSKNLRILIKKYGNDKTKKVISPLSRNSSILDKYSSIYQINSPFQMQAKKIVKFISKRYKNRSTYIFYDSVEKGQALYIKNLFKKENRKVNLYEIMHTDVDSIRLLVNKDQCVIIPSFNKIFVSKMLSSLGAIDSSFVVFGLNNWKNFDNLDIQNLMALNIHFSDPYFFNDNNSFEKRFLYLFENKYNSASNRFAYVGYQILLHFCSDIKIYKFHRKKLKSGYLNIKSPMFYYDEFNLELIK